MEQTRAWNTFPKADDTLSREDLDIIPQDLEIEVGLFLMCLSEVFCGRFPMDGDTSLLVKGILAQGFQ